MSDDRRQSDSNSVLGDVSPRGTVVIIDDNETSQSSMGRSFIEIGYDVWLAEEFDVGCLVAENRQVDLVVTEQKVGGRLAFAALSSLRNACPHARNAIVTAYPSVANAVRAMRLGYDAYVAKPVTAPALLEVLAHDTSAADVPMSEWPSLDRTIWEYLNQVCTSAGSISEAARRLRLDRRSLRRMLAKFPPVK